MELSEESGNSKFKDHCKSAMNVLRRAFSFRDRRSSKKDVDEISSIELQPVAPNDALVPQPISSKSSEMASTSASCSQPKIQCIYEDPFVAVKTNGTVYVKHYYNFYDRAEYRLESIRSGTVRRNSRRLKIQEVVKVYYAAGASCKDETVCKNWGICMNDVWWASHLNRMEDFNTYTNVVLLEDGVLSAGFSVVNIDAFAESIQSVGLPRDAPFQSGLPSPPISMLTIPFIDEDPDETPKKRKNRRKTQNPDTSNTVQNLV